MRNPICQACLRIAGLFLSVLANAAHAQDNLVADVWEKYRTAVVRIEVSGTNNAGIPVSVRQGTGIIVRPSGKIITALRVVGRATEWRLNPDETLSRVINVNRLDAYGVVQQLGSAAATEVPEFDIALLDINATGLQNVEIDVAESKLGSHAVALPWDPGSGTSNPIEAQITTTNKREYGDRLTLVLGAFPGNNGAPVFGSNGKLIGIITSQIDANRALAVPGYLFVSRIPGGTGTAPPPLTVTFSVCSGEYEAGCQPHDTYLYCYVSIEDWATNRCQSHKIQQLNTNEGGICNYRVDAVICTGPK
jgi:S1-C subfamily serine protease